LRLWQGRSACNFGNEKTSRVHPDNLGVIGLPLFMKFDIIFDYFNNNIYIEPNEYFNKKTSPRLSGGFLMLGSFISKLSHHLPAVTAYLILLQVADRFYNLAFQPYDNRNTRPCRPWAK